MRINIPTVIVLGAALGGCAASEIDRHYGQAVHSMVAAQVVRPETLQKPSTAVVEGVDPDVAKAAVDSMRKENGQRTHAAQPLIFTYGGQAAGQ